MCDVCIFGYVHINTGTLGVQKMALDPLELELWVIINTLCGCWEPNSGPL